MPSTTGHDRRTEHRKTRSDRDQETAKRDFRQIRDPREKHDVLLESLSTYYAKKLDSTASKKLTEPVQTDYDVLQQSYRFLRTDADDSKEDPWVVRIARHYYDRLYREYALCDLSKVSSNHKAIGLRWRTHKECIQGKGQFSCGAIGCDSRIGLESFEVPFAYKEVGEKKSALVKVRVCEACSRKLLSCRDLGAVRKTQKKRKRKASQKTVELRDGHSEHDRIETDSSRKDEDTFSNDDLFL